MDRTVWCLCHTDLDGACSGAIVKQAYPNAWVHMTNYGRSRPIYKVKPGDLVFVTDFTLTLDEFLRLKQKGADIVWIDHHAANVKEIVANGFDCPGIRRDDYCGAALTWMYLHQNLPPEAMPEPIKLVNDYDLWKFEDPRTKAFSYGCGLWDIRPGNPAGDGFWSKLLSNDDTLFKLIIKYGSHIQEYVELMQDTYCNDLAYYTTIPTPMGPKNILALTVRAGNSSVFDRMDKEKVDALFTGQYVANIGKYRCSMYSPDNVKEILPIVQMFGGGGHPKAAGWQPNNFPIPPPQLKPYKDLKTVLAGYEKLNSIKQASVILKQWVNRASSITLRAQYFHSEFGNFPALCVNHQYLPDLLAVSTTASDCINPKTSVPAKVYLGWVMTNTGWYRCCVFPTDTTTSLDEIKAEIMRLNPEAERTLYSDGKGWWWYQRDIPVRPPIIETPLANQRA